MGSLIASSLINDDGNNNIQNYSNERDNELLNEIYKNNGFVPLENREQIIRENIKHTKTYESPILIKPNDIKFERDSIKFNIYYIVFKYSSSLMFDVNFYFNCSFDIEKQIISSSDKLKNLNKNINDIKPGNNELFMEKNCSIDLEFFYNNKIIDKNFYDMIIECIIFKNKPKNQIKCKLFNICKIIKIQDKNEFKCKIESQKLFIKKKLFDMHNIFGLEGDFEGNKECEVCYNNLKNTIFLPCYHSYACEQCAILVRLRGNKCPLCRHKINDFLLIDNINKINLLNQKPKEEKKIENV